MSTQSVVCDSSNSRCNWLLNGINLRLQWWHTNCLVFYVAVQHERGPRNSTIRRQTTVNYHHKNVDDVSLPVAASSALSPYWSLSSTTATSTDVAAFPFNATLIRHPVAQVWFGRLIRWFIVHFIASLVYDRHQPPQLTAHDATKNPQTRLYAAQRLATILRLWPKLTSS